MQNIRFVARLFLQILVTEREHETLRANVKKLYFDKLCNKTILVDNSIV